ncbi:MAG: DMT family transporter [Prolixibacteraceae bacterium]|jgi:transporter family protein|nr:DMT family transporter [Prolixibacteraceae bacterium]
MWALLGIIAAVLLGFYDVFKKTSLNNNAVIPVLLISISTSAFIYLPFIIGSELQPDAFKSINLYIPTLTAHEHLLVFIKAVIVLSSWILAFFAIKHLPLTIVTPIRATGPLWTLVGALIIFAEHLNGFQWIGIIVTLVFFYLFSTTGKLEGIHFRSNKWVLLIILATLLGSASGLYDKYIVSTTNRLIVQAWSGIYQLLLMLPIFLILWYPNRKKNTPFKWRWSIPLIGIFLVLTDFFYFYALSYPEALISILSGIRRSGVIISFIFGAIFLHENNIRRKSIFLIGILAGVLLMVLGSN